MSWPEELLQRDFRPAEVEEITGRSQQVRRKWEERGFFDFPRSDHLFGGDGKAQWYSWVGVQMIALFGQVMADTQSSKLARASLMVDPIPNLQRNGIATLEHDWRDREFDYFAICDLSAPEPIFLMSGPNFSAPVRAYIINISELQRTLFNRFQKLPG